MPHAIVGRERELEGLEQLLGDLEEGAAALIFDGGPGIGKTTVWGQAVDRARSDCVVLSARPDKAEGQMAFATLADLLEAVGASVIAGLPEPQRAAIAIALLHEEPGQHDLGRRAVGAATLNVLRALAADRPVLVAVDDIQWVDHPSANALEFALRRLEGLPVGVLACERSEGTLPAPLDLRNALPDGRCTCLTLEPLSLAALDQVLKGRLGRSFPRRALLRIERAAGGNPFFALELGRSLPEDASTASVLPLPQSLRAMVEDRIAELPQSSRDMLLLTAALGSPTADQVLSATSMSRADALVALERAAGTGVIDLDGSRITFAHPLFGEGVYSLASPGERRAAHLRLAQVVDGIEEVARHLALGAPQARDGHLAEVLDEAAEHARRRGAPDVAAQLAEQARTLTPLDDAAGRRPRSIRCAEYHFHAGELRRGRELLESVLEGASGRHRADALRLLGEIRNEDSVFEANELFEEALEHVGDDLELRSGLHLRLAYGHNAVGDWAAAGMHGHHALRLLERLDQPGLLAEALAVVAIADALNGRGVDEAKVERALALEDPNRQVPVAIRPSLIAGCLALYEGRLERSEQLLLPLRRRVAERGEESDLAFVSGNLAWSACWRGDLDAAAAYVEEALESAMRSQSESWRCLSLSYMAVQAAYAGDAELTRTSLAECRALAPRTNMRNALRWAGWAEAVLALSIDDPQTADTALGTLAAPFANARVPEPILVFFLPDEIEALIALGRLDGAEPLLESFAEAAERLQREWARMMAFRCRALLLAASGDLDAAAGAVSEALGLCHGLELRIEVARTLLVAGQLARRQRKKRAAKDYLEQAYGLFERMGARLWAERAAAELGRVGLRPAAPDELTSSERQVAELTASGLKNREVAAQLFRSPKTVEATLARVYRKLEIHSRAELGARLAKGTERERAQT